jgi:hypothetical protein
MDLSKLIRISEILQDGAVTPEEGKELIDGVVMVLEKIRPQLKKWWFRVMLDGIKVSLMELKEHLEEIGE